MNFLMNELPQIRPVLFVQAGNVVSIDVGEVGFRHGSCTRVPSSHYRKVGRRGRSSPPTEIKVLGGTSSGGGGFTPIFSRARSQWRNGIRPRPLFSRTRAHSIDKSEAIRLNITP